jgi:hypothetical protein
VTLGTGGFAAPAPSGVFKGREEKMGADVDFRVVEPDNVLVLQRFHERLSDDTTSLRFFGSIK